MRPDLPIHRLWHIPQNLHPDITDSFVMRHILRRDSGNRKTYQMDPANGREAMREVEEDIAEGADLIIAKPAMAYMDIITEIRRNYNIPIVAYNVSGEYSMVKSSGGKRMDR